MPATRGLELVMAIDSIRSTPVDDKAAPRSTTPVAPSAAKPIYTCPMHPEVQQDHPGNCPKCGMTLELKTVTAGTNDEESAALRSAAKPIYTCPMHPEVQQDHPGNCPKCGMTLELKTVTAGTNDEESAEL